MRYLFLLLLLFWASPAFALFEEEALADPVLESRALSLEGQLRCIVCDGQSIKDSDTEAAASMRVLIREQIKSGMSDEEVVNWLEIRYGEDVSLMPEIKPRNMLLWLAPLGFLLIGLGLAFRSFKKI